MYYIYKAKVLKVYDGDTFLLEVDKGFGDYKIAWFRLHGVDTPEMRPRGKSRTQKSKIKEKELAKKVKQYVSALILNKEITIVSHKGKAFKMGKGKYGRWLAEVFFLLENLGLINLGRHLISKEYAVEYFGGKKEKVWA